MNLMNMNPASGTHSERRSPNMERLSAVDIEVQMGKQLSENSEKFQNEEKDSVSSLKRSKNDMHIVENIPEEK